MAGRLFFSALLLSILCCAARDLHVRREISARRQQLAQRQVELQKLGRYDREVRQFQEKKDRLEKRIDLINQLKQNQKGAAGAVEIAETIGGTEVDSIAVVGPKSIVVNSHGKSRTISR